MLNRKFYTSMIVILLVCVPGTGILEAGDLEIFINGGVTGGKGTTPTNYLWEWGTDYIGVLEDGSIASEMSTGDLGFSAGLNYFISPSFGVSLSITRTKRTLDLFSNYAITWTWGGGEYFTREKEWTDTGSVSLTPIMTDMILRLNLSRTSFINLRVGVGVVLTQLNLDAHMGYGEVFETDEFYYIDWYALKVEADKTDIHVVAGGGIELEQKITGKLGLYAGMQYFYIPAKEITVDVEPLAEYHGEEGQLYTTEPPDIHWVGPFRLKLHFSFFKAFAGIKIYL